MKARTMTGGAMNNKTVKGGTVKAGNSGHRDECLEVI